jgi:hypothetical protein
MYVVLAIEVADRNAASSGITQKLPNTEALRQINPETKERNTI